MAHDLVARRRGWRPSPQASSQQGFSCELAESNSMRWYKIPAFLRFKLAPVCLTMAARGYRSGKPSRSSSGSGVEPLSRRRSITMSWKSWIAPRTIVLKLEISRPVAGDVSLGNGCDSIFVPARSQMSMLTQEAEAGSGIEMPATASKTASAKRQRPDTSAPPAGALTAQSMRRSVCYCFQAGFELF